VIRGLKLHTEDESVLVNGGVAWQVTPLHLHSIKIIYEPQDHDVSELEGSYAYSLRVGRILYL